MELEWLKKTTAKQPARNWSDSRVSSSLRL
jgi:hypothetical protein